MILTIAMPCYDNFTEVWFTVEALRLYQDLTDCEILVLDNKGSDEMYKLVKSFQAVRYEKFNEVNGTGPVRNEIFKRAKGDFVLIIDSHVFLWKDNVARLKWWLKENWEEAKNLIQGTIVLSSLKNCYTNYLPQWRAGMWGIWPPAQDVNKLGDQSIEIEMGPLGLFGCRKDSWLGFHPKCKGFDGIEGVIHAKYRKYGRKVLCLPWLRWVHFFGSESRLYPLQTEDKIRNLLYGFKEIGLDIKPIYDHFGDLVVGKVAEAIKNE
ncbi:MAG TPA: glycosyltransferase family A protein [Desulfosporosinus sp.]|nr:glycosyltransferase family A protein [Desulfosporosinus sp.]